MTNIKGIFNRIFRMAVPCDTRVYSLILFAAMERLQPCIISNGSIVDELKRQLV